MKKIAITIIALAATLGLVFGPLNLRERPNVLLISIDTLRPDHLGCYGYKHIKTPNIDRIAKEGIIFKDAITSVPLTLPSHSTILTGLCPLSHNVRDNGAFVLRDEYQTLTEVFKTRGYSTGAFIGAFVLDSRYGLAQGFDVYEDNVGEGDPTGLSLSFPERRADAVTDAAIKWLENVKQPFFAFVHYFDPHSPYEPPPPFDSLYAGNLYDGEIAFTDQEIGRLMKELERRDLKKNTLIVIVSDHGEGLLEHDELTHGLLVYETTLKVALIINLPEKHSLKKKTEGIEIDQTVGLIDVMPTILELAEIDFQGKMDGLSLLPLLEGKNLASRFLYFETMYPHFANKWSQLRGIRFNKWKLIYSPEPELYDLKNDPHELRNLYESERTIAEDLKANLAKMVREKQSESMARGIKPMSPEEERRLRALGYISQTPTQIPVDIEPKGPNPRQMMKYWNTYLANAMSAFTKGQFDVALKNFTSYLEVDPNNIEARMLLGRTLMEMGRLEEASKQFLKATEIDSTFADGFFRLGLIYREQGELDRALVFFKLAVKLQPQIIHGFTNIGAVLVEKGKLDSARIFLHEALRIDPKDHIAMNNLGQSFALEGKADSALFWYHRALSVNPRKVNTMVAIGSIYADLGMHDSVAVYLEKARELAPRNPEILKNLGSAYRATGRIEEAQEAFERALEVRPNDYMAMFGLAAVLAEKGKTAESIEMLKKVLEIEPDFQAAKVALSGLTRSQHQP